MAPAGALVISCETALHQQSITRFVMLENESGRAPAALEASPLEQRTDLGSTGRPLPLGAVGFVGLGHMGTAMAANLAATGIRVIAYVRRREQIEKLKSFSLEPTMDFSNLAKCKVVISMLTDDHAAREIVFGRKDIGLIGLAKGLLPGAIHLSMSTISTATVSQLKSEHERHGQGFVAAPVFGNPAAAGARQLFIAAAGAPADVEYCLPLLDNLGRQTFVVGDNPADASLFKLLGNMITATALEMMGEVIAVIRKRGLDPKPFMDLITSTNFGGRAHKLFGDKIVTQNYEPGFVIPLALKDVRLALTEAENVGVPMPSVAVVRDRMITGIARGHAGLDWSALGLIAAEEAGIISATTGATQPQAPAEGAKS
jgi:3-hydroxyisobutyrate dehydrogenase-like beta-hydroxyacid dehydrogenase